MCYHAATGEYRYYLHGVHKGNVDKECAERFSKKWPICPGSGVKRIDYRGAKAGIPFNRRNGSAPLNGRNGGGPIYGRNGGRRDIPLPYSVQPNVPPSTHAPEVYVGQSQYRSVA